MMQTRSRTPDEAAGRQALAAPVSKAMLLPVSIKRGALLALLALAIGLAASGFASPASAARVPNGFSDDPVLRINLPTALASTPDGRMLVTNKSGRIVVMKNGTILRNPALNVSSIICSNRERGLLGVAVDPQFKTNKYV